MIMQYQRKKQKQQGSTVIMVLLVLSVLVFSSLVTFRSADTNMLIAGNISTKSASSNLGDMGVRQAINAINLITDFETQSVQYYPVQQPVDNWGLPTTIDWATIPSISMQQFNLQFVTERLCSGAVPIGNPDSQCTSQTVAVNGSKKSTASNIGKRTFFYRSTIRITGVKGSNAFIQAIIVK